MRKFLVTFVILSLLIPPLSLPAAAAGKSFAGAAKEVKINPLAVYESAENPFGKAHTVKVRVQPSKTRKLRVGFFEEEVAGTGAQWRSAGWMAATTGTFLLGLNLADYKFSFDVTGRIDGPSAGALMTVAVVASILGDKVKKDATMTGTINPDGTIGPVGGIPQKIDGAKKAGKKLVLIPAGQRFSLDLKTQETIDVINYGRKKGVTVREVSDIYDVYPRLTGKKLPKAKVSDSKPDIPSRMFDKIKGKSNEWYSRYTKIKADYATVNPAYKTVELDELMSQADGYAQKSSAYLEEGLIAPSYNQAILAVIYADLAFQASKIIEAFLTGGLNGANAYLESSKSNQLRTDAMLDRLKSEKPRSLSDITALTDAYGFFSSAVGLVKMGDTQVKEPASDETAQLVNLARAITSYSLAGHVLNEADDSLDIGMGEGARKKADKQVVKDLSEALRRAAEANIEYFDNVVLAERATQAGVSLDIMRQSFADDDFDYAFAVSAINVLPALKKELGKGASRDYATLGNSLQSYSLSSGLLAKYYSLQSNIDESGQIISVANEKALINMLDIADRNAVENINLARKIKGNPSMPTAHYEAAKILREGSLDQKLDALFEFWSASTQARILTMLSGKKVVDLKR